MAGGFPSFSIDLGQRRVQTRAGQGIASVAAASIANTHKAAARRADSCDEATGSACARLCVGARSLGPDTVQSDSLVALLYATVLEFK